MASEVTVDFVVDDFHDLAGQFECARGLTGFEAPSILLSVPFLLFPQPNQQLVMNRRYRV